MKVASGGGGGGVGVLQDRKVSLTAGKPELHVFG